MNEPVSDPIVGDRPSDLLVVRVFLLALAVLLAGYMFLGRGFAHLGMRPIYVGEAVLLLGLLATGIAILHRRSRFAPSKIVWLLLAWMLLGVARTVPYLSLNGIDALRDAVLWGYAVFALIIFVLADRALILRSLRIYGWVVPVFALWLPVAFQIFAGVLGPVPLAPGSDIPLVFFKNQDMAVHTIGAIAFLVLGTTALANVREFVWRSIVVVPLAWGVYITGSISRGALAAVLAGLGVLFLLAPRSRNWVPIGAGGLVFILILAAPGVLTGALQPGPTPQPTPIVSFTPSPPASGESTSSPDPSAQLTPKPTPTPTPSPEPTPQPTPSPTDGRAISPTQWIDNIASLIFKSSNEGLEGTKQFRLAWWTKIVEYTVFGPYFWTGKGFGVNLADDDGFQPNADGSLRAPHNSHMTTLARMGVPGFVLWVLLQGAFGISLLRSSLIYRRVGDLRVAAAGAWILIYWVAMLVNTSFDPYLEGPQGGIWFWTLFGLGLTIIQLTPRQREA